MHVVNAAAVSQILRNLDRKDAQQLLDALSAGLGAYTKEHGHEDHKSNRIHQPARTVFKTVDQDTTLVMPVSDSSQTAVKVVTVPHAGDIQGAITLYSPVGDLLAVLSAAEITAFRTALAVMTLLVRWRAPPSPNLLVFGAGKQVEWHIRLALLLVPGIPRVTVVNRGAARLQALEERALAGLKRAFPGLSIQTIAKEGNADYVTQVRTRLADADIVCCCTPSREPLFVARDLSPVSGGDDRGRGDGEGKRRRFISLIGSYTPDMQEIDTETLKQGQVYVDSKEACLAESGELIRAGYGADDLVEVGELYQDGEAHAGLDEAASLTIMKCVGFGLMDLVVARALVKMAEEKGVGLVVDGF